MASSIALRRATQASPHLLNKFLLRSTPSINPATFSSLRSFNNNASAQTIKRGVDEQNQRNLSPKHLSDHFFDIRTSLSQLLNMMDNIMESPFLNASSKGLGVGGLRRGWDAREDEDALYLKIEMPGLGKENVKVSVEQNTLTIKGKGEKEKDDVDEIIRTYSGRIDLPEKIYKLDQVKAEMKNGLLRVNVPKVKEEAKKDVFQVNVE